MENTELLMVATLFWPFVRPVIEVMNFAQTCESTLSWWWWNKHPSSPDWPPHLRLLSFGRGQASWQGTECQPWACNYPPGPPLACTDSRAQECPLSLRGVSASQATAPPQQPSGVMNPIPTQSCAQWRCWGVQIDKVASCKCFETL